METLKFIQSFSNPFWDSFFIIITKLGTGTLGIFLALIFLWCYNKKLGYKLFFALSFSLVLNNSLKTIINSKRPIGFEGIRSLEVKGATGSSFPSGHAQLSGTFYTYLIDEFKSKWLISIGILMMILTPLSRLYLGVHWPIDVIVGTVLGVISVYISNFLFERYIYNCNLKFILIAIFILLISLFFFQSKDYIRVVGGSTGLIFGYYIENTFVRFNPKTSKLKTFLKILLGLLGYIIIHTIFKTFFPENNIIYFCSSFALICWGVLIAPMLFIKLKLSNKITSQN